MTAFFYFNYFENRDEEILRVKFHELLEQFLVF
jgi:hypothetical protein